MAVYGGDGGRTYVMAGGSDGVQVIDITNPHGPVPGGVAHEPFGDLHVGVRAVAALRTAGGTMLAITADGAGQAGILDVTDPGSLARAGTIPFHQNIGRVMDVSGFVARDGTPYVVLAGRNGSGVVDVSDPGAPGAVMVPDEFAAGGADTLSRYVDRGDWDAYGEGLGASKVDVFKDQNGRLHAALIGEGVVRIIDVDDPARFYAGVVP